MVPANALGYDITTGLVGYWKFDEDSGTVANDSSGYGNHGTAVGNSWDANGRVDGCISLRNATDYVVIPNSSSLQIVGEITISAWVKADDVSGTHCIIGHGPNDTFSQNTYLYAWYGNWMGGSSTGGIDQYPLSAQPATADDWYHLVSVYNGTEWRLYVNGVLSNSLTTTQGAVNITNGRWVIGGTSGLTERFFDGLVDDVRIYNRGLAAEDVDQLYVEGWAKKRLLLVVPSLTLSADEWEKKRKLEEWKFATYLHLDSATQTEYDTALTGKDVAYVTENVIYYNVNNKLRDTKVGVVSGQPYLDYSLGFNSYSEIGTSLTSIQISDNTHYITSNRDLGNLSIFLTSQNINPMYSGYAKGLEVLAESEAGEPVLAIIEAGKELFQEFEETIYPIDDDYYYDDIVYYDELVYVEPEPAILYYDEPIYDDDIAIDPYYISEPDIIVEPEPAILIIDPYPQPEPVQELAQGRRVRLPWGGSTFFHSSLNSQGRTLLKRSLDWAAEAGAASALRLHLRLDELSGTTAYDSSGNSNNGTYINSPVLGENAIRRSGVAFDNNSDFDRVNLPHTALNGLTDVSFAWWMKTTKEEAQAVLSGASPGKFNSILLYFANSNTFRFHADDLPLNFEVDPIATNTWVHYSVTYERSTGICNLYIDGQFQETKSLPSRTDSISIAEGGLTLAEEQDSIGGSFATGQSFVGVLDDFRIYSKVLTPTEIAEIHGLVGHWKLDEATGLTAVDSTNSDDDGSLSGSVSLNQAGPELEGGTVATHLLGGYVDLPNMNHDFSEGFAVSMWVNPSTIPSDYSSNTFLSLGVGAGQQDSVWIGWLKGYGLTCYTVDIFDIKFAEDPLSFVQDTWVHCVVNIDEGGYISFYHDGKQIGSSSYLGLPENVNRLENFIGQTAIGENFNGLLHDVRLYNRPISDGEIQKILGDKVVRGIRIVKWSETPTIEEGLPMIMICEPPPMILIDDDEYMILY